MAERMALCHLASFLVLLCDNTVAASHLFYTSFLTKHPGNVRFSFIFLGDICGISKEMDLTFFYHFIVELEILNFERDGSKGSKIGDWN